MITAKQAVDFAKAEAAVLLGAGPFRLEELEKSTYQDRDCWSITLSFPERQPVSPSRGMIAAFPDLEFKRFFVDAETGNLLGMAIREFAIR